jgi:pSer/pThr/pTyr-binding forkhead associated (FHA) protein
MENIAIGFLLGIGGDSRPIPIHDGDLVTLGRDLKSTVPLDDWTASRKHAIIEGRAGAIFITDLGSSNGTFVSNSKIKQYERVPLYHGIEFLIGGKLFVVVSSKSEQKPQQVSGTKAEAFSRKPTLGSGEDVSAELRAIQQADQIRSGFALQTSSTPDEPLKKETKRYPDNAPPEALLAGVENPSAPQQRHTHALEGMIGPGRLPQIIQWILAKGISGRMNVSGDNLHATILVLTGELYSARTAREQGAAAIYCCALEQTARFTFDLLDVKEIEKTPSNVSDDTPRILLECCLRIVKAVNSSSCCRRNRHARGYDYGIAAPPAHFPPTSQLNCGRRRATIAQRGRQKFFSVCRRAA